MSKERLYGWDDAEHNRYTVDDRINDFFYNKKEIDALLGAIDPDNPNLGGGGFVTLEVYADDQAALELEQQAQDTKIDANTAKNVSQDSNIQANSNDITVLKGKVNALETNQHELYDDTAIWLAHDQLEADVTNHFNNHGGSYDDTAIWLAVNNNTQGVEDNAEAIANLEGGGGAYDDTEVRGLIQDNADAIAGKADDPHTHDEYLTDLPDHDHPHTHTEYQPVGDYATNTDLTNGLAGKSDTTHTHPPQDLTHDHNGVYQPVGDYATKTELSTGLAGKSDTTHTHSDILAAVNTKWGMWTGTQAEYDALGTYNDNVLYVVV
jgi:hypothetical protein